MMNINLQVQLPVKKKVLALSIQDWWFVFVLTKGLCPWLVNSFDLSKLDFDMEVYVYTDA